MPHEEHSKDAGRVTRRRALRLAGSAGLGLTGLGFLAGCGDDEATTSTAAAKSPATAAFSGRLVTLGYEDESLALGVTPAAIGVPYTGKAYPHLVSRLKGVPSVGKFYEPDIEKIVSANPTLIISDSSNIKLEDQLGAIAPTKMITLTSKGGTAGVAENLTNVGTALGVADAAVKARIAQHDKAIATAKSKLAGVTGTVAFLRVLQKELRLVVGDTGYIAPLLYEDLGLQRSAYVESLAPKDTEGNGYIVLSFELVPKIDADHLFFLSEDAGTLDDLSTSPLWKRTKAVEAGSTFQVDDVYWQTTAPLANEQKAADVVAALA